MWNNETKLFEGYIYCVTNLVNGKRYIGQTIRTIDERWKQHCYSAEKHFDDSVLYRAIRLYGQENFSVTKICKLSTNSKSDLRTMLNDHEAFYIIELHTQIPSGYNMTAGGQNAPNYERSVFCVAEDGCVIAQYCSAAEAAKATGTNPCCITRACRQSKRHYANGLFWYYASDLDTFVGDNIGKQTKYRNNTVYQFSIEGELLAVHISAADASVATGVDGTKIRAVCNGDRMSAGGFIWSYNDSVDQYNPQKNRVKPVKQMDMLGNVINVFDSIKQAEKESHIDHSRISACCLGKRKSTGGYRWAFII